MIHPKDIFTFLETPSLYQSGAPLWTEPHIAEEMLKAHLSPNTDAASSDLKPSKQFAVNFLTG